MYGNSTGFSEVSAKSCFILSESVNKVDKISREEGEVLIGRLLSPHRGEGEAVVYLQILFASPKKTNKAIACDSQTQLS